MAFRPSSRASPRVSTPADPTMDVAELESHRLFKCDTFKSLVSSIQRFLENAENENATEIPIHWYFDWPLEICVDLPLIHNTPAQNKPMKSDRAKAPTTIAISACQNPESMIADFSQNDIVFMLKLIKHTHSAKGSQFIDALLNEKVLEELPAFAAIADMIFGAVTAMIGQSEWQEFLDSESGDLLNTTIEQIFKFCISAVRRIDELLEGQRRYNSEAKNLDSTAAIANGSRNNDRDNADAELFCLFELRDFFVIHVLPHIQVLVNALNCQDMADVTSVQQWLLPLVLELLSVHSCGHQTAVDLLILLTFSIYPQEMNMEKDQLEQCHAVKKLPQSIALLVSSATCSQSREDLECLCQAIETAVHGAREMNIMEEVIWCNIHDKIIANNDAHDTAQASTSTAQRNSAGNSTAAPTIPSNRNSTTNRTSTTTAAIPTVSDVHQLRQTFLQYFCGSADESTGQQQPQEMDQNAKKVEHQPQQESPHLPPEAMPVLRNERPGWNFFKSLEICERAGALAMPLVMRLCSLSFVSVKPEFALLAHMPNGFIFFPRSCVVHLPNQVQVFSDQGKELTLQQRQQILNKQTLIERLQQDCTITLTYEQLDQLNQLTPPQRQDRRQTQTPTAGIAAANHTNSCGDSDSKCSNTSFELLWTRPSDLSGEDEQVTFTFTAESKHQVASAEAPTSPGMSCPISDREVLQQQFHHLLALKSRSSNGYSILSARADEQENDSFDPSRSSSESISLRSETPTPMLDVARNVNAAVHMDIPESESDADSEEDELLVQPIAPVAKEKAKQHEKDVSAQCATAVQVPIQKEEQKAKVSEDEQQEVEEDQEKSKGKKIQTLKANSKNKDKVTEKEKQMHKQKANDNERDECEEKIVQNDKPKKKEPKKDKEKEKKKDKEVELEKQLLKAKDYEKDNMETEEADTQAKSTSPILGEKESKARKQTNKKIEKDQPQHLLRNQRQLDKESDDDTKIHSETQKQIDSRAMPPPAKHNAKPKSKATSRSKVLAQSESPDASVPAAAREASRKDALANAVHEPQRQSKNKSKSTATAQNRAATVATRPTPKQQHIRDVTVSDAAASRVTATTTAVLNRKERSVAAAYPAVNSPAHQKPLVRTTSAPEHMPSAVTNFATTLNEPDDKETTTFESFCSPSLPSSASLSLSSASAPTASAPSFSWCAQQRSLAATAVTMSSLSAHLNGMCSTLTKQAAQRCAAVEQISRRVARVRLTILRTKARSQSALTRLNDVTGRPNDRLSKLRSLAMECRAAMQQNEDQQRKLKTLFSIGKQQVYRYMHAVKKLVMAIEEDDEEQRQHEQFIQQHIINNSKRIYPTMLNTLMETVKQELLAQERQHQTQRSSADANADATPIEEGAPLHPAATRMQLQTRTLGHRYAQRNKPTPSRRHARSN